MTTIRWREISFFISKYTRAISLCFFARNFYFFFSNAIVFDAKLFEKNNNNHNTSLFIPNNAHLHISVVCRDRLLPFKLLISDVLQKFEIFWIFVSRCVSQTNSNAHIEWYMLWLSFLFFFLLSRQFSSELEYIHAWGLCLLCWAQRSLVTETIFFHSSKNTLLLLLCDYRRRLLWLHWLNGYTRW